MSHRWEHEDEYLELKSAFRRAQKEGNDALCQQLQARIKVFDEMMWHSKTTGLPELAPYHTVVEALERTAARLGLPFPDLADPRNRTGSGQFIFVVSDGVRTVQIWPMEDRGYYDVELFDYAHDPNGHCYQGQTSSLDQVTLALSRWFVERYSIASLHEQCSWVAQEPFRLSGPRMTLE